MIVGKALKNYIERAIKEKLGLNPDGPRIARLESECRNLRRTCTRQQKEINDLKDKCYLEEDNA